jgi:CMP-N-acetylneuraminic acid synthetase
LWIKFTARYKVNNISTPLFYYRQHDANLTSNEKSILDTRAKIKENFAKRNFNEKPKVLAIIPVRGSKFNSKDVAFLKLGEEFIIDIKINEAINSEKVDKIIVSSPDTDIEKHIKKKYKNNNNVIFHFREDSLARLNTGLVSTIDNILNDKKLINSNDFENIIVLSIEYPFVNSKTIDDAINTMQIFNTDSLISVREETNVFFQHDGGGMKPILNQEKFSKLERESLYRYAGGIIVTKTSEFSKSKELISGKVGHIVIHQKSAHTIKTKLDIEIANFLYKNKFN